MRAQTDGSHWVVLYLDHGNRRFSITARKAESRLPGVNRQMDATGYKVLGLPRLAEGAAGAFRDAVRAAYEAAGYEYQTRPPLS